jgi:hypothetical protein
MTKVVRPSKSDRANAKKARRDLRKPKYTTPQGGWSDFKDVIKVCNTAQLQVHADAEKDWTSQIVNPANRKVKLIDGRYVILFNILNGNTSGVQRTDAQKQATSALMSATQKSREHGQRHYIEAAAIKEFVVWLNHHFPKEFEWQPLPDGLGADFIIRRVSPKTNQWCAVQVKSAKAHDSEQMNFNLAKPDGEVGGKYEHMVITAMAVDPELLRPIPADGFNTVTTVEIKDLFVFQNASAIPGKSLQPFPRQSNSKSVDYGSNRYTAGFDVPHQLEVTLKLFADYVDNAPKFSREDAWFGKVLNSSVSEQSWVEVMNCKALSEIVGFDKLTAPLAQNECTDTIAHIDGTQVKISLKTATLHDRGFRFKISRAPNASFCDIVLVFYIDRITGERTHVSVLSAKEVYSIKTKAFYWSGTRRVHILKSRISLSDAEAARKQLQEQIKEIMM